MAQPTPYDRSALNGETYFTSFSSGYPTTQQPGNKLDQEFNAIALTLSQHAYNLALIQRDDGRLANGSVHYDALDDDVYGGINPVGQWVTGTLYNARDAAIYGTVLYRHADTEHTASATFADDLADYWTEIFDYADIGFGFAVGALNGLTPAANTFAYFTATEAASLASITAGARALLARTPIAGTVPYYPSTTDVTFHTITAAASTLLRATPPAANTLPYFSSTTEVTFHTVTAAARSILDDDSTSNMLSTLNALGQGVWEIPVHAVAMWASTTNGAEEGKKVEMAASQPTIYVGAFDGTTAENLQFGVFWPKGLGTATVKFRFVASNPGGNSSTAVAFSLKMLGLGDSNLINQAMSSAVTIHTTLSSSTHAVGISAYSADLTIANMTAGGMVFGELRRETAAAQDTMTSDAYLHSIKLAVTQGAVNDA